MIKDKILSKMKKIRVKKIATCKRDHCNNPVYSHTEAQKKYLCETHYEIYTFNKKKKNQKKFIKCARFECENILGKKRNIKYCSSKCRNKISQLMDKSVIRDVTQHTYWRYIEDIFKKNLKGMASIEQLSDIINLVKMYKIKERFQKSYSMPMYENSKAQTCQLMTLKVSHLYPNNLGGSNHNDNLLIIPNFINQVAEEWLVGNNNSDYHEYEKFKVTKATIPLEESLYSHLIRNYKISEIKKLFNEINSILSKQNKIHSKLECSLFLIGMPFYELLQHELKRLRLHLLSRKMQVFSHYFKYNQNYIEFASILVFLGLKILDFSFINKIKNINQRLSLDDSDDNSIKILNWEEFDMIFWKNLIDELLSDYFDYDIGEDLTPDQVYNSFFPINMNN
ncbi:hypothetical protein PROVRETT_07110 [Providencia rettgeri DSM 1131]|nr:hypothetical protein PROVRETT_07110 [Providencia rettgeri DSM 1131]